MSRAAAGSELAMARAAKWVVRLASDSATPGDYEAFVAWLASDPAARDSYDAALSVWLLAEAQADVRPSETTATFAVRSWPKVSWRGVAAAVLVAVLGLSAGAGWLAVSGPSQRVLETGRGERRTYTLAQGARVTLAEDSRVVVRIGMRERTADMGRGEAVFDVGQGAIRPLRVVAGDDALRVIGAEIGLRRRDGRLRVVVRRGAVAIGPAANQVGPRVQLTAGTELNHVDGTRTFQVSDVDAATAFAW